MLCASPLRERFELVEIHTHRDGSGWEKLTQAAVGIGRLAVLLARRRVDLVHIHTASDASFRRKAIVAAASRLARRPYVVHVHGGGFAEYAASAGPVERAVIARTLRAAARVVVLTDSWKGRLAHLAGDNIEVVPNPVASVPEGASAELGAPARIVCLGRLGDDKGSRVLVQALARLGEQRADVRLCLAGDGDQGPIRLEAERLGVIDRVELPGWVDARRRDQLLAGSTIFALPSRVEGLPMALLEAMAFGLPAVVTPVGGVPDVVGDGHGAIVVTPDDPAALANAFETIMADPARAIRMGAWNRAQVDTHYAVERVAERLAEVFDAALGTRPRRGR